jgi:hypothetical protein
MGGNNSLKNCRVGENKHLDAQRRGCMVDGIQHGPRGIIGQYY